MEELVLTDPVVEPEKITSTYRVTSVTLCIEPPDVFNLPEPAVVIDLRDNHNGRFQHMYLGDQAVTMIKQLNTANLSTKSMHKRILEKLSTDGVLPGTVTGTPDP